MSQKPVLDLSTRIGLFIRTLREQRKNNQREFWGAYNVPSSRASQYETGRIQVPLEILATICEQYQLDLNEIVGLPIKTKIVSPSTDLVMIPLVGKISGEEVEFFSAPADVLFQDIKRFPIKLTEMNKSRLAALQLHGQRELELFDLKPLDTLICIQSEQIHQGDIVIFHHKQYGYRLRRYGLERKVLGIDLRVFHSGFPNTETLILPEDQISIWGHCIHVCRTITPQKIEPVDNS